MPRSTLILSAASFLLLVFGVTRAADEARRETLRAEADLLFFMYLERPSHLEGGEWVLAESWAVRLQSGHTNDLAYANHLGAMARAEADPDQARRMLDEAIRIAIDVGPESHTLPGHLQHPADRGRARFDYPNTVSGLMWQRVMMLKDVGDEAAYDALIERIEWCSASPAFGLVEVYDRNHDLFKRIEPHLSRKGALRVYDALVDLEAGAQGGIVRHNEAIARRAAYFEAGGDMDRAERDLQELIRLAKAGRSHAPGAEAEARRANLEAYYVRHPERRSVSARTANARTPRE